MSTLYRLKLTGSYHSDVRFEKNYVNSFRVTTYSSLNIQYIKNDGTNSVEK